MKNPTVRCAKDWSRTHTMFADPNTRIIQVGALLRIADALEEIERHLFELTPEGRQRWAGRKARAVSDAAFNVTIDRAVAALARREAPDCPKGVLTPWVMASALVGVCGESADADDRACWQRVLEHAPLSVRGWGAAKNEYLRAWVRAQWPEHGEHDHDRHG